MPTFHYRRRLTREERLRALGMAGGAALGVGAVVFYFARIFLQRTPLREEGGAGAEPRALAGER